MSFPPLPAPLSFEWSSVGAAFLSLYDCYSPHDSSDVSFRNTQRGAGGSGGSDLNLGQASHHSCDIRRGGHRERAESPCPSLPYSSWALSHRRALQKTFFVLVFHSLSLPPDWHLLEGVSQLSLLCVPFHPPL